jgi:hypothetical protein
MGRARPQVSNSVPDFLLDSDERQGYGSLSNGAMEASRCNRTASEVTS